MEDSLEKTIKDIRARIASLRAILEFESDTESTVFSTRSRPTSVIHKVDEQGPNMERARKEKELDTIRKKLMSKKSK